MSSVATELLQADVLQGTSILVVGASQHAHPPTGIDAGESLGSIVGAACEQLGSRVSSYAHDGIVDEAAMSTVVSAASESDGIDMLVFDGSGLFASGGLRACMDIAWDATRAVVNLGFLGDESSLPTRRIVYLAPPPGAGERADAARAGLENLARTLSVEWARHEITTVTIALGDTTTPGEAAALTTYLASPAGAYFSGCLLDLRGV
jgi:NAD(P)-dependent dehydrogenase (short-subunit alcohol dehydrogenase family)